MSAEGTSRARRLGPALLAAALLAGCSGPEYTRAFMFQ